MKKLLHATCGLLIFLASTTSAQVTVNGGPTLTYTSLNTAFAAINAGTHFGAITIDITGNTIEGTTGYAPTPLLASGQSSANYTSIIIRPTVQATVSGDPATGRGVIELDGADNVIIDGDIVAGPVQRDLTFEHTGANTLAATAVIRLIGRTTAGLGATNNTIQNCILIGNTVGNDGVSGSTVVNSYGIYMGTNAANLTTGGTGDNYDNNTISNNEINRAYFGVWIGGNTTNPADNNLIAGNLIGSNTVGQTITYIGINLTGIATSTITQNEIFNLKLTTSVNNAGIQLAGTGASNMISRNTIWGIHSLSTGGYGAYGINLTGGNNHIVVNNAIYDIKTINYSSTSTTWNAFGIRITSGTGISVYYNTINLFGQITVSAAFTSVGSSAFLVTSTAVTGLDVRNNIFNNSQFSTDASATTRKFMTMWFPTSYNFMNATIDRNAYNIINDADHIIGKVGTTNNVNEGANLAGWQAFSQVNNATNDVNSVPVFNFVAPFTSNTNLTIPINTVYGAESGGIIIASLGTNIDINGNVRPLAGTNPNTDPDMGAYEFDGLNASPTDVGIINLVGPAASGCYSSAENVITRIKNYGTNAASNIPVTVIISGAVRQTLTGTYAGSIPANGTFDYTLSPTLNMSTVGLYNFKSYTSLTGDAQLLNDTLSNITLTVTPVSPLPQFVDFTGFTGSNLPTFFPDWNEGDGAALPTGTISSWTSQTNFNTIGNTSARVLLSTAANTEWIVGPKILATANTNISFDAGISDNTTSPFNPDVMGSDDMVQVMVSTDCGASFSPIFTISATNSLTPVLNNFNVSLSAYAGQNIIVGFLATDGPVDDPESYYFHLDNINIYNASPSDAGTSAITSPGVGCFTASEPVVVDITNYGTASITNFPVNVWISGPVVTTLTATYTGIIAPSAVASFTVGTLNMTAVGNYTLKSFTSLSGDSNNLNDSTLVVKTTLPLGTLPQFVDFTGYTGANLTTFFPDWREGDGSAVPNGTISSWTSQTNFNTIGNTSARVLLSSAANTEWIVGPKVLATANTNMSFDAGISDNTTSPFNPDVMGSDDMVQVMVSTDCGNSYTPIFTISATNSLSPSFTNFNVSLSSYAGQEILVGFLATDGPVDDIESYYFHLDNINLYNASATDAGVDAVVTPSAGCFTNAEPVVVNVKNFGVANISNFPVTVWVSGAATQTLTSTFTGILAPSASANFTVGTLNMSAAGNYSLKSFPSLAGDTNNNNDTTNVVQTTLPLGSLPQFVNFNGYTGANLSTVFPDWREGDGATVPTATTSSWINQANFPVAGNTSARVFLSATANTEWIVGPKVLATASTQIAFDAGITAGTTSPFLPDVMGSDDMVRVMVSTDCGTSYAPIFTISATNSLSPSFTNFNVSLSAYAGQEILVAFLATDGPVDDAESYYFHLDNINLYNNSAIDGGVTAILTPTLDACLSATEQVVVTVHNFGLGSITNFPVTAHISGPVNTTITSNYTGVLAPSTSDSFTIGTANMNLSGTYTINAFTGVSGDPNAFNDAFVGTYTQTPDFSISGGNYICTSGSQTLTVVGSAATYTWFNSSNASSVIVSPSSTTIYSATGTGTNNCQVTAFFTVDVITPTITGIGAAVCGTNVVGTLTANAFAPVSWYATPTSTSVLATGNTFTATSATTTTFYAEAVSSSNASIATTFSAGNGCAGNMFDVTATSGNLVIDSMDVHIGATTSQTVYLYYKTGTYVGNETTPAAWTAWDTIVVTGAGAGNPTKVVPTPLLLNNSQVYGFYVTLSTNDLDYSSASAVFSNADISLQLGVGICSPAFNTPNANRTWNGNLYYSKPGCISPKIPVTLTVTPQPTVTINTSPSNVICAGNTVTLTASGVDTYTWSTSATSTVITATPFTSTTYTVDGSSVLCPGNYTASVLVSVNALPTVSLTAGASTICSGTGSISLNGLPTGGIYSGASVTGSLLSIANPGTFVPVYTYTNSTTGCSNSASTTVIVANCTGLNVSTVNTNAIAIYPNPNNGNFVIDMAVESPRTIEVTDITGRVVLSIQSSEATVPVNISDLANGMYQVRIVSQAEQSIFKIVKY